MRAFHRILPLAILGAAVSASAQQAHCGLTTMTETVQPVFPPIAKAAHVEGVVVMLVDFDRTGTAQRVHVISGPEMLRQSATASVKTWRANSYSGPRSCPVAITFHISRSDERLPPYVRPDVQHIVANSNPIVLYTPNYSVASSTR